MNTFDTIEDLARSGYLFRIQDNGGASADRYTVVFSDGDCLALSGSPSHPQGVSISGDDLDPGVLQTWQESGEGVDMALGDLPRHIALHIVGRLNEGWSDFLRAIADGEPNAVAASREKAKVNEGTHDSGGVGIYRGPEGLMVRLDGPATDDRGPYETPAKALVASLPDDYALAGPEYHSTTDVNRLEPSSEVAAAVAALEAKVDAEWQAASGRTIGI